MSIAASDPFKAAPRISEERFGDVLRDRGANPELLRERSTSDYYRAITAYGVDPLLILAMFNHESQFGTKGTARQTHSWGNTRTPNFGAEPVGMVKGRSGSFPEWANWLDGCVSTVARLVAPDWVYHGRTTIREIFDHSSGQVWAPAGDMNDPHGYLRAVLDFMNMYATEAPTVPDSTYPKPSMVWHQSPNKNGYAEPRKIEAICNHIATGSKASNLSWLTNPDSGVSCNFYIARDGTIYEMVPVFSNAWCNGVVNKPDMSNPLIASWVREGVNPNTRTVSIEHEGQASDTLTEAQIASNNKVTAWVASTSGLPVNREHIIGHYQIDSVNKPFCPSFSDDEWERLIDGANALLNGGQKPQDDPGAIEFPETGCKLILGFKGFWEELAGYQPELPYRVLGLPITNEGWATLRDDGGGMVRRRVQICERGSLIWNPDEPSPWDLTLMLKSQEEDIIDFEEDV